MINYYFDMDGIRCDGYATQITVRYSPTEIRLDIDFGTTRYSVVMGKGPGKCSAFYCPRFNISG